MFLSNMLIHVSSLFRTSRTKRALKLGLLPALVSFVIPQRLLVLVASAASRAHEASADPRVAFILHRFVETRVTLCALYGVDVLVIN